MSKLIVSSLAGAACALATPAFAGSADGVASGVTGAAHGKPKAGQRSRAAYDLTGSHIRRKECKTRREWFAEGMDPLIR